MCYSLNELDSELLNEIMQMHSTKNCIVLKNYILKMKIYL